ncbi:acyl transferase/acyl hydrolase/lysophospholipase [Aspergillus alliaceus]|uniref:acyl transferase/acyl hydrolase/lysophospholipase n=1 Tax=Petromyces alliaceus TaxID=209559 RepID=UPI0012A3E727|nr:acyl transferase/acyl hydrolase/lysophospholipase [Aspergillus alliaceus]KAB8229576.1 acyl transferase/acyl hydrolase/lysophospholipase [Aspergillus alliaceus]
MMMMQQRFIPLQASHTKMNHNINVREDDILEVVTDLRSWDDDHKVAIINNYGACGSNASMIVAQAKEPSSGISRSPDENRQYPFWIPGIDSRAITAYCTKLASLTLLQGGGGSDLDAAGITKVKAERPVILCFGGQVSLFVRLDRKLYDSITIFRQHPDRVDSVVTSLGEPSIFPDIFSREPVQNPVKLQTMLFAMQIAAVVGHSFGEITALCVAGVLKLQDTVRLVIERAKLVRGSWEPESGAMMAVEADESVVHELVQEANRTPNSDGSVSIACYNGPRSFTLAGTTAAVDAVQLLIHGKFPHIRSKRLSMTNAFHSKLVEKLAEGLGQIGKGIEFQPPVVPIERATEEASNGQLDWTYSPTHAPAYLFQPCSAAPV